MRGVKHWTKLSREVVEPSSLERFKTWPDRVLGNLLYLTLLQQGNWSRESQEAPFQSQPFCDSMKYHLMDHSLQ